MKNIQEVLASIKTRLDYRLIHNRNLYEWQKSPQKEKIFNVNTTIPNEAEKYLNKENPFLKELQSAYSKFNEKVTIPLIWNDEHLKPEDIVYFRGDNAYVWQLRGPNMNVLSYALTTFYIKSIDKYGLLGKLKEDESFGNFTFRIDNKVISRDLLDSIAEIYFLDKYLNIYNFKDLRILDIGAGYGRLAYRAVNSLPNIKEYFCTDAVPVSTFISDYYLRFRNVADRAKVIRLDKIEDVLKTVKIDIAINIHSFSECNISAIEWWISLLAKNKVRYLFIVPNSVNLQDESLLTNDAKEFSSIVKKYGYNLIVREPKYTDLIVQTYGINPAYYYLFSLS